GDAAHRLADERARRHPGPVARAWRHRGRSGRRRSRRERRAHRRPDLDSLKRGEERPSESTAASSTRTPAPQRNARRAPQRAGRPPDEAVMTLFLALLFAGPAQAGSLDNFEVGGPWGTPTATDGTAVWWNPAGLAAEGGTRIMIEGAPLIGRVNYTRTDQYGFGGTDTTRSFGVVPYLGVATDAGVKGLGLGLSVSVPVARGGAVDNEIPRLDDYAQDDPVPPEGSFGRYHLREARVQAMYVQLAAAYEIKDRVAFGAGIALVNSTWQSRLDTELVSALDTRIEEQTGNDSGYRNDMVEDP